MMILSFTIEPQILHSQEILPTNYIQNSRPETVEIVANNLLGGEIYSYQEENSQNFSDTPSQIITFNNKKNYLFDNKTQLMGSFIHTLSTNLKEVQQIRAP